jgi:hypothetical protein
MAEGFGEDETDISRKKVGILGLETVLPSLRRLKMHQWVLEFVTQYWFSMYYSSRDN